MSFFSALGETAKAVTSVFNFKAKKYDGDREDRLKRELLEAIEADAKWRRRQKGWEDESVSKVLGG